jgi:hypothetical protein
MPVGVPSKLLDSGYIMVLQSNEYNAVISRAVLPIENCDALAASRLMTLLNF